MSNTQVFNISLPSLQAAFESMKNEAGWDINNRLYWGYYFLDDDLKKLESFGKKLEQQGYQVVEIRKIEERGLFLLHIEENVIHSPKSLFNQCHKLAEMAKENGIEIFDGWDVEPIQISKGLVG